MGHQFGPPRSSQGKVHLSFPLCYLNKAMDNTNMSLEQKHDALVKEHSRVTALLSQMVEMHRDLEKEHSERVTGLMEMRDKSQRVATAFMAIMHQKQKDIPSLFSCSDDQLVEITEAVIKYTTLGCDFEVIVNAIQENPLIASEWERFTSFLRFAE